MSLLPSWRSAVSNHSRVRPGASSGSIQVLVEIFFFRPMSMPHRNDALATVTQCPGQDDKTAIQITDSDESPLTVFAPLVSPVEVLSCKNSFPRRRNPSRVPQV